MKKYLFLSLMFMSGNLLFQLSYAQNGNHVLASLPGKYVALKDALVSGDAKAASAAAALFYTEVTGIKAGSLNGADQKVFQPLQSKLSADAKIIAGEAGIAKQREIFARLSLDMITLAKGVKLSTLPFYVDYCPMKKASWLSAEKAIKNPYYGASMLTCGKITDTL
jgi:Protein of unknown function (DUF3347)